MLLQVKLKILYILKWDFHHQGKQLVSYSLCSKEKQKQKQNSSDMCSGFHEQISFILSTVVVTAELYNQMLV